MEYIRDKIEDLQTKGGNSVEYYRFKDKAGEWRWHLKADNGRIIADSGEGYKNLSDCDHAIGLVKSSQNAPLT